MVDFTKLGGVPVNEPSPGTAVDFTKLGGVPIEAPAPGDAPGKLERFGRGLTDVPVGVGQLSAHAMDVAGQADPYSFMGLLDKVRRASANLQGVSAAPADIDKAIATREEAYQARRNTPSLSDLVTGNKPDPGIDWLRLAGNLPLLAAAPMAAPEALAARIGMGAVTGAGFGAAQPVTSGDFAEEKLKQAGIGALAGGALAPVGQAITSVAAKPAQWIANKLTSRSESYSENAMNALRESAQREGVDMAALPQSIIDKAGKQVQSALDAKAPIDAAAALRQAQFEAIGMKPTLGQVTREPGQFAAELDLRGVKGAGEPLATRFNEQNKQLIEALNKQGAAGAEGEFAMGQKLISALKRYDEPVKKGVDNLYQSARGEAGRSAQMDQVAFTNIASDTLDSSMLGYALPPAARTILNDVATGKVPLTVNTAEQLKTVFAGMGRGTSVTDAEKTALGAVRDALENTPIASHEGDVAKAAFDQARAAAKARFGKIESTPALKAALDDVPPDQFFRKFVLAGNQRDIQAMTDILGTDTSNALKSEVVNHLKNKALNSATDEVGNFSQSAYNKELTKLTPKLAAFMSPAEVEGLRTVGRVASYIQGQPAGSAVNNSNTAAAVMNLLSKVNKIPWLREYVVGPLESAMQRGNVGTALQGLQELPAQGTANVVKGAAGRLLLPAVGGSTTGSSR